MRYVVSILDQSYWMTNVIVPRLDSDTLEIVPSQYTLGASREHSFSRMEPWLRSPLSFYLALPWFTLFMLVCGTLEKRPGKRFFLLSPKAVSQFRTTNHLLAVLFQLFRETRLSAVCSMCQKGGMRKGCSGLKHLVKLQRGRHLKYCFEGFPKLPLKNFVLPRNFCHVLGSVNA